MVHLLIAFKRKDGLSREAFSRHWRKVHAPLARRIPGLHRYVQNHTPSVLSRSQAYDGATELWFHTLADLNCALTSTEYRDGLQSDAARFVDTDHSVSLITDEYCIV